MTIEDTLAEKRLCAELTMLLGNATSQTPSFQQRGFRFPFASFVELCDGDARLARRVLLRAGWVPGDDGNWTCGKGMYDLERAIPLYVLEEYFADILNDYRPLDEAA